MRRLMATGVLSTLLVCASAGIGAQERAGSSASSQATVNDEMLKELKAIHQLLEKLTQPPSARPTSVQIANLAGFSLGSQDAPLMMVEFTDLQCPFCRQYAMSTFDDIKKNWIDTGKLRYISRDFPLDIHPQAMPAARAVRCAGEQGKFWEMRLTLVKNANLLTPDYINKVATDISIDRKAFGDCAASPRHDAEIRSEQAEGMRLGITGTPTFAIGKSVAGTFEGRIIVGALPYSVFETTFKGLIGPQ